jgi:hypothetical protein
LTSEREFKVRELERLLSEGKITIKQYLDARVDVEKFPSDVRQPQSAQPTSSPADKFGTTRSEKTPRKIILGLVLCAIVLFGGFFAWSYLYPVRVEALEVEDYSFKLLKGAILFELRNVGNTEIRILKVKMNSKLNQSVYGWRHGWNGTTFLSPGQTGTLYVYFAPYFHVINASMPKVSSSSTQQEWENFISWAESYNCTFTFVTSAGNEFDHEVRGLVMVMIMSVAWMGTLTFTFMGTEELNIIGLTWGVNNEYADFLVRNTGSSSLTIIGVEVNDAPATMFPASVLLSSGTETSVRVSISTGFLSGVKYEFAFHTSSGNRFTYIATAP